MHGVADRRVELKNQLSRMGVIATEPDITFEQVREVFLDGNRASNDYLLLQPEEKRHTLGKLLSNASIRNKTVAQYQFKSPYDILARMPKNASLSVMCTGWNDIRTVLGIPPKYIKR